MGGGPCRTPKARCGTVTKESKPPVRNPQVPLPADQNDFPTRLGRRIDDAGNDLVATPRSRGDRCGARRRAGLLRGGTRTRRTPAAAASAAASAAGGHLDGGAG